MIIDATSSVVSVKYVVTSCVVDFITNSGDAIMRILIQIKIIICFIRFLFIQIICLNGNLTAVYCSTQIRVMMDDDMLNENPAKRKVY